MPRFETYTCYHCEAEATGREHVPPKCLYPKGGGWSNLMTVPSCAEHNNAKSTADEYLKFLLGEIGQGTPHAITRSAARGAIRQTALGRGNLRKFGFLWDGKVLVIDDPISIDFELLSPGLAKVARATYFYHHLGRRKLLGDLLVCPLFIPIDPTVAPELASAVSVVSAATAMDFGQSPKLGPHQEIFAYQVFEGEDKVTINMELYKGHWVKAVSMLP
jgi:hypothetical protein